MEMIHYWLKCLGGGASFFLPWTPPPGPACRGEPWCCEACADGPPESTHPARCLRTGSTPAEPGRWRSTASEGEEAPKRSEKFSFVKLSASVLASQARFPFSAPSACLCRDCSEQVQLSVRGAGGSGGVNAYICLDELTALLSYSAHGAEDIHPLFHVHHVDHAVNDDKRPGPPHPSAAERNKQTAGSKHRDDARAFCLS